MNTILKETWNEWKTICNISKAPGDKTKCAFHTHAYLHDYTNAGAFALIRFGEGGEGAVLVQTHKALKTVDMLHRFRRCRSPQTPATPRTP